MSVVTFFPLVAVLGVCLVPVWLLRRPRRRRAQDYLVAAQRTRPEVAGNASIASALRMAAFAPLFAWGASGDLWPVIVAAAFLGLGVLLVYKLREPLLGFLDAALTRDRSITVHEFMARQHGNDRRVRVLSASLTLCALLGLLVGEALALSAFLKPMLGGSSSIAYLLVIGTLLLIAFIAAVSGHSGTMHSSQLLLGMFYLGLFGSTVLLLYLHLSARAPMPGHGTFAVVFVAVFGVIALWYRRSKYVDSDPIRDATASAGTRRESSGARALTRLEKILNICLSVLLVLIIAVALMELNAAPWASTARDSMTALQTPTKMPMVGLLALAVVPLFYPLVDLTSWLRLAATEADREPGADANRRSSELRGVFRTCAIEASLMWLFLCMFGAIAAIAVGAEAGAAVVESFTAGLGAAGDIAAVVSPLLLVCIFAAALSATGALFSACLCTVRYDLLAPFSPELAPGQTEPEREATARRRTLAVGGGLALAVAVAFCCADAFLHIGVASRTFVAMMFAFCSVQLSFVPLVLGPIVGRGREGSGTVSAGWALAILGFGAASSAVAVAASLATGVEAWLWSAAPACLGAGLVLFAMARAASHRRA
jgi:hypothetical protein